MPTRRATACAVRPWSPVDDDDPDPGLVATRDRVGNFGTRRVEQADEPEQTQLRFGLVACVGIRSRD